MKRKWAWSIEKLEEEKGKLKLAVVGFYCCDSSFGIGPNASFITK